MSTYYKSEKATAILDILLYISSNGSGKTALDISSELNIKDSTARNYLNILESKRLVEKHEDRYIVGSEAASFWSRRIAFLKSSEFKIKTELENLGEKI